MGELLGRQGNLAEAAILYATARETYRELGQWHMFGYLSVLIAELFLLLGRSDSAEAELRAALPLIEKFDLRREGAAAVALLGEAVANKKRDLKTIQVLRDQLRKGT